MAGKGERFGSELPKQFCEVNGKPLFTYVLEEYKNLDCIDKVIVVTNPDFIELTSKYAKEILEDKLLEVIPGGDTNAKSIYNGVMCAKKYMSNDDILLTHDATNPIVATDKILEVVEAAKTYDFASLCTEQVHTIYNKDDDNFIINTLDRKTVCSGYSPEAFKFNDIYDCYINSNAEELETMTSAISLASAHNKKVKLINANILNLKITYKEDLDAFSKLVK